MSCLDNQSNINETFIIEPTFVGTDILSACTAIYTNEIISCSGDTKIFMGSGVITFDGNLYTNDAVTANTIYASTYYSGGTNLLDIFSANNIYLTGGTFDTNSDTLSLYNSNGSIILVTGFTDYYTTGTTLIGKTVYFDRNDALSAYTLDLSSFSTNDIYTTGLTFSNNQIIITRNDGVNLNTYINYFTGLTIGNLVSNSISATTISATTFYGDGSQLTGISAYGLTASTQIGNNLFLFNSTGGTEIFQPEFITGGTFNQTNRSLSLTNNTGGTVTVTGISDTFVTGGTFNNTGGTLTLINNSGGTFSVTDFLGQSNLDIYITGGTFNNTGGTLTLINSSGGTTQINGFFTNFNSTYVQDVHATTYTLLLENNLGTQYFFNPPFITGGTYSNGILTLRNPSGNTVNIAGFYTGYTLTSSAITSVLGFTPISAYTDTFVTGGTYTAGTLTLRNITGGTFSVSGFSTGSSSTFTGVTTAISITGNGISTPISLVNDESFTAGVPQTRKYYGIDRFGNKTFHVFPDFADGNIYDNDGTLLSDRILDLGGFNLTFFNSYGGLPVIEFNNGFQSILLNGPADKITIENGSATKLELISGLHLSQYGTGIGELSTELISSSTSKNFKLPNQSGVLPLSVNGFTADTNGNITIPVGGTDIFTTGGTYTAGTLTLRNTTGGTFSVTGFTTGGDIPSLQDVTLVGATTDQDVQLLDGASLLVDGNITGRLLLLWNFAGSNSLMFYPLTTFSENRTIGIADRGGILPLSVNGFTADTTGNITIPVGGSDTFVTGATFNNNLLSIINNTGGTVTVDINNFSGLTVNGFATITGTSFINGLTVGTNGNSNATVFGFEAGGNDSFSVSIGHQANANSNVNLGAVAVGYQALFNNTSGANNTAIGYVSQQSGTTGGQNASLGFQALQNNISGSQNTSVGYRSSRNLTGSFNTAVGNISMINQIIVSGNTAIGYASLAGTSSGTSTDNTAIGFSALRLNNGGARNTVIGYQAGELNLGSDNVMIGYKAGQNETGSNQLYIGNTSTSNPLIKGDFSASTLNFNANVTISSLSGTGTQMVVADSNGQLSKQAIPSGGTDTFTTGGTLSQSQLVLRNNTGGTTTITNPSFIDWTDYSNLSTIVGFSAFTAKNIQYMVNGKTMFLLYDIRGAGTGTTTTFTLPFNASSWAGEHRGVGYILNNNTTQTAAIYRIQPSSSTIDFSTSASDSNFASWNNGTTRRIIGQLMVNIA